MAVKKKNNIRTWIIIGVVVFILILLFSGGKGKDLDKVSVMDNLEKGEVINNPYLYANNVDTDGDGLSDFVSIDNNKDGSIDFAAIDVHGDEILDSFFYDLDNTGVFEVIKIDFDGDAKIDVILYDLDEDGLPDNWDYGANGKIEGYDTDGDGFADSWDFDNDGIFDDFDKDFDGYPDKRKDLYGDDYLAVDSSYSNNSSSSNDTEDYLNYTEDNDTYTENEKLDSENEIETERMYGNCTEEEYSKYTSDHTSAYMALLQDPDNQELKDEKNRAKELLDSCEYTP
ncbi:hypothetical protein GW835_01995 [archaeon]|nr:hypothetical protein [archaeon]NCP79317.1 hypothetical protein [archaeon]NCQ07084.1 hypothetical protein [archaeon]NCQ50880.1 hypothetical protein [archaeon]NCT58322.1 hypothetical protein [archaeon]